MTDQAEKITVIETSVALFGRGVRPAGQIGGRMRWFVTPAALAKIERKGTQFEIVSE